MEDRTLLTAWTAIGPAPLTGEAALGYPFEGNTNSGRITGIAADPSNANTVYIATAGGGVWKTTDANDASPNWTPLTDNIPGTTDSMGAIAVAPSNSNVLYAGTGEANNVGDSNYGEGILVSTNGGSSWTLENPNGIFTGRTVSKIVVDPANANIAYAAIGDIGENRAFIGGTGVFKTSDGGATWTNLTSNIVNSGSPFPDLWDPFTDVALDPNNSNTIYTAIGTYFGGAKGGIYKSTDGGTTWSLLSGFANGTNVGRIAFAIAPTSPTTSVIYAVASDANGAVLEAANSTDGGNTWNNLGAPNFTGRQGTYDLAVAIDPTNSSVAYFGGSASPAVNGNVYELNGTTWTSIASDDNNLGVHADIHALVFDANNHLLVGNDGGIYRKDSDPNNSSGFLWTDINGNLNTIQFVGISLNPSNGNVIGGSQDNGTQYYDSTTGTWTATDGGDGGIAFANGTLAYHVAPVGSYGSSFFRVSNDGGQTWTTATTGLNQSDPMNFYAPFTVDSSNASVVVFGSNQLYETTNAASSWSQLTFTNVNGWNPNGDDVDAIGLSAASNASSLTIYAATGGQFAGSSQIFVSTDGGSTWTENDLPSGSGRVNQIIVDPNNSQTAYAVVSTFGGGHVFKTTNGGTTWTDISGNLPDLPTWAIQLDPASGTLYIGNDQGVYNSTDGGTTWNVFGTGLPNAQVFSLNFSSSLNVLAAGTYGRGAWEIPTAVAAPPVVTTLSDENDPNDGTMSLREAIAYAETLSGPQTITFDPSILTQPNGNVIDLQSALPDLTGNITIQGPGANVLTVQRDASAAAFSVFTVDSGATAAISGLTISGGSASANGGGISNAGTLTVSDCTLSGNFAASGGGGILNNGTLTVSGSTLSGNDAETGGGIYNTGSLTVSNSTLSGNTALSSAANGMTGGGIFNQGNLAVSDSTLSGNSAGIDGGGIEVAQGDVLLHNTLVAGNVVGSTPSDVSGSLDSASDYNLIGDGSGGLSTSNHNLLGTSSNPLNPLLAALSNYGGPTPTQALLPGSPAIDAGSGSYGGSTDQRGDSRLGATDIGAFESQGFTIAVSSGNNQSASVNTAFANPLVVSVSAKNAVEPVAGGLITFTVPSAGASAVLTGSPATLGSGGTASVTATANGTAGTYTVSAAASGIASPVQFSLANKEAPSLVVSTLSDENSPYDGTTSLREAIAYAETLSGAQTITFASSILTQPTGNVLELESALPHLTSNLTIQGPGANVLTVQRDANASAFRVFTVDPGSTATISGLTISGGSVGYGSGIYNAGSLTVSGDMLSGNSASSEGGALFNASTGTLTVNASTLSGDAAVYAGGVFNAGSLTVTNSTLSGNSAQYAGGLYNASGNATLTNTTLAQNSASVSVGGIDAVGGDVLLHNTLVAGNLLKNSSVTKPSDVANSLDSVSDYSLIGDGSGKLSTAKHNLLGTTANPLNPLLAALSNYGGPTPTQALLPGSPAIDAGSSSYGGSTDQRGDSRLGATDIGAFESQGFTIAVSSGNNQSASVNTAFANPLIVTVTAKNSIEPVAGGAITFTAPSSGASAVLTGSPATLGSGGTASVTATANGTAGTYSVSAAASGIATPVQFSLANKEAPSLVVSTLSDENSPYDGTTSLREAIAYAETLSGPQTITIASSILTKQSGNIIDLLSALPHLTSNLTIQGPGANVLTVQRDANASAFRVFTVDTGATAVLSGLTIAGGSVGYGSGIYNAGSLTVSGDTLSGNSASSEGGALFNASTGTLTINASTLSGGAAVYGGGLFNAGSLTITNSTLSGNSAQYAGGLYNASGNATLTNATLAQNSASVSVGGIDAVGGDVLLHNTLVAGNVLKNSSVMKPSDVANSLDSASDYSLIGDGSGKLSTAKHNLLGTSANPLNPLLAPLGSCGGPTPTQALLPGSPAIDAGSSSYGGSTDQRGKSRVNAPDIGAFESQGFTIAVSSGNNQSASVNTAFANPLIVTVTAKNSFEPVAGGAITFTVPSSGASAILTGNPATLGSGGTASVTATANGTAGTYNVSAAASGIASPVQFSLANKEAPSLVVSTLSDENSPYDGTTSLREAIASAETLSGPQTITIAPSILTKQSGNIIDLLSALPHLTSNLTIQGPGANVLTVQRDANASAFRVFTVDAGSTATISGLTIAGGSVGYGSGIYNAGSLTVSGDMLSGNSASSEGGAVFNASTGTLTVNASTLSGDAAVYGGGVFNAGSLTITNSTLSGNSAQYAGGLYNASGNATLTNATLAQNSASVSVGGIDAVGGDVLLHNTLVAGNVVSSTPSDVSGSLDSASDYSLIGDGRGGLNTTKHNLLGTSSKPLNPLLAALSNYGGPTPTQALLPGSPAIDAGSSSYGGSTDQRGDSRLGATDIGAFESQGFTIAVSSGNNQSANINTAFANPLIVTVTAKNSIEPVAGGIITFAVPSSGASAVLAGSPATLGSGGTASVTATANGTAGTYTVSAAATGIASPAQFSLTNTTPPSPANSLLGPAATPMAAAPSPPQDSDQVMSELGQSWDLLLAGLSVQVLKKNPQAGSLANAID